MWSRLIQSNTSAPHKIVIHFWRRCSGMYYLLFYNSAPSTYLGQEEHGSYPSITWQRIGGIGLVLEHMNGQQLGNVLCPKLTTLRLPSSFSREESCCGNQGHRSKGEPLDDWVWFRDPYLETLQVWETKLHVLEATRTPAPFLSMVHLLLTSLTPGTCFRVALAGFRAAFSCSFPNSPDSLMPSKYGCCSSCSQVCLSAGSIWRQPLENSREPHKDERYNAYQLIAGWLIKAAGFNEHAI